MMTKSGWLCPADLGTLRSPQMKAKLLLPPGPKVIRDFAPVWDRMDQNGGAYVSIWVWSGNLSCLKWYGIWVYRKECIVYNCWKCEEFGRLLPLHSSGWSVGLTGKAECEAGRAKTNWSLQRQTRTCEGKIDPTETNWNCKCLSPPLCWQLRWLVAVTGILGHGTTRVCLRTWRSWRRRSKQELGLPQAQILPRVSDTVQISHIANWSRALTFRAQWLLFHFWFPNLFKISLFEKNGGWTCCGNRFTTYVNQTITQYALNLYGDVRQLFLNKTGGK